MVFFGLPLVLRLSGLPPSPLPFLIAGGALSAWLLMRDPLFERRRLFDARGFFSRLRPVLILLAIVSAATILTVWLLAADYLFCFTGRYPWFWLLIVIAYPPLSVYPQELIYRAFLFHRYRRIFISARARIIASALAFSFGHAVLAGPLAAALTLAAGGLLAWRYHKTASLLVVALEHSLYGIMVFTVGLERFFYSL